MAVYLFTYHAYRSWMPDRPQGYVKRDEGVLPPDPEMARHYHDAAAAPAVQFDPPAQQVLVDATCQLCPELDCRLHQVRATPTHLHILLSWTGYRDGKPLSNRLKRRLGAALSAALNRKGPWFSRGGSRKRVRDRGHFDYLMHTYLPRHGGRCWREDAPAS